MVKNDKHNPALLCFTCEWQRVKVDEADGRYRRSWEMSEGRTGEGDTRSKAEQVVILISEKHHPFLGGTRRSQRHVSQGVHLSNNQKSEPSADSMS